MPAYVAALDVLHVLDQGLILHVLGSVLHTWAYDDTLPAATALSNVWEKIRDAYKELKCEHRLTNLTLSMICDPARPHSQLAKLRCKAAEARHLLPALAIVARGRTREDQEMSIHISSTLESFSNFYLCLAHEGFVLSPAAAARASCSMDRALLHYVWLRSHFTGTYRFRIIPKTHFAKHLARSAKWLNPRFTWTYKSEDYVGQMAEIALSCSHGTAAHRVNLSLTQKYRIMCHLRLTHSFVKD